MESGKFGDGNFGAVDGWTEGILLFNKDDDLCRDPFHGVVRLLLWKSEHFCWTYIDRA